MINMVQDINSKLVNVNKITSDASHCCLCFHVHHIPKNYYHFEYYDGPQLETSNLLHMIVMYPCKIKMLSKVIRHYKLKSRKCLNLFSS